jgi:hypothetical protein
MKRTKMEPIANQEMFETLTAEENTRVTGALTCHIVIRSVYGPTGDRITAVDAID